MKKYLLLGFVFYLFTIGCNKNNITDCEYKYEVYGIKTRTFNQSDVGMYLFSTNEKIEVGEKYVAKSAPRVKKTTYLITNVIECE